MTHAERAVSDGRPRANEARAKTYAVAPPTPAHPAIASPRATGRRPTLGTAYDPRANNFDFIRFALASLVCRRVVQHGKRYAGGPLEVHAYLVDFNGNLLGQYPADAIQTEHRR